MWKPLVQPEWAAVKEPRLSYHTQRVHEGPCMIYLGLKVVSIWVLWGLSI